MTTVTDEFTSSNKFIEKQLDTKLCSLADYMAADVITIAAPMANPVDELVRYAIEDIKDKRDKLIVILENDLVRPYYRLLQDYMQRVRHSLVIHTANSYQGF